MDDTARKLMNLLWTDPRIPLMDISKRLGISRQTVHRRLQDFEKMGVFRNFRASIGGDYMDAFVVAIWGRSQSTSIDRCLDRLGESRFTWRVEVLGGNQLFVMAEVIDMKDLDRYVAFVKSATEMTEPTIGIMCFDDRLNAYDPQNRNGYRELSPLDLKIIGAMRYDARKPAADIAKEVGVSAKTVRRRLTDMVSDGAMVYNQPWDLTAGEDMMTMLFVRLRSDADKISVAKRLLSIDPVHFNYLRSFSNIPGFLVGLVFSDRPRRIRAIVREIAENEEVVEVAPNLVYDERMYWDHDPRVPKATNRSSRNVKGRTGRSRTESS